MAIEFPLNPVDGDEFNAVGRRFRYTSPPGVWESVGSSGEPESDPIFSASPAAGITSTNITSWNESYSWGDHALAGYLTSYTETDPVFSASPAAGISSLDITNWNTAYGWGDHAQAGYLTSFTEIDPTVPSWVKSISISDRNNWDTAYGWGDHAQAGYLTSYTEADTLDSVTGRGSTTNNSISVGGVSASGNINAIVIGSSVSINAACLLGNNLTASYTLEGTGGTGSPAKADIVVVGEASSQGGNLVFKTNPTTSGTTVERMRIDASGNVGIGTSPVGALLHLDSNTTDTTIRLENSTQNGGYIQYTASDALRFYTGSSIRATIDSSGNVGIGDAAPTQPLSVRKGSSEGTVAEFYGSTDGKTRALSLISGTVNSFSGAEWTYKIASSGGEHVFSNLNGELLRIKRNGNVGIGVSDPDAKLELFSGVVDSEVLNLRGFNADRGLNIRILNASSITDKVVEFNNELSNGTFSFAFDKTRKLGFDANTMDWGQGNSAPTLRLNSAASSAATLTYAQAGVTRYIQQMFSSGVGFYWGAYDSAGANFKNAGTYTYGTAGANDSTWNFRAGTFYVKDAQDTATHLTVDSSGNLLIGKTAPSSTTVGPQLLPTGEFNSAIAASTNSTITNTIYSTTAAATRFYVGMGGNIYATSTSITAISDASLKENVRDLDKGLDTIKALKPRRYDWKNGDGTDVMGFIAQEVEEVMPELVYDYQYTAEETKKGLKMGDMLPSMVKAIQELAQQVEDLQAELAALKSTGEA